MKHLKVFCLACLAFIFLGEFLEYRLERHIAASGLSHLRASHWLVDAAMAFEALAAVGLIAAISSRRIIILSRALTFAGIAAICSSVFLSVAALYVAAELGSIGARNSMVEMGESLAAAGSMVIGILMVVVGGLNWSWAQSPDMDSAITC